MAAAVRCRVVRMCDSSIFTKAGCEMDYEALFERYEAMNAEYGVMIDVLRDGSATLGSALQAREAFLSTRPGFKLVAVAQGGTPNEYLDCFTELAGLGFEHIAIGGVLTKNAKTSRWVAVRDADLLPSVLRAVRGRYPKRWLFALGCYHPKRHDLLLEHTVWGSDWKGWIFDYRLWHQEVLRLCREALKTGSPSSALAAELDQIARLAQAAEQERLGLVALRKMKSHDGFDRSAWEDSQRRSARLTKALRRKLIRLAARNLEAGGDELSLIGLEQLTALPDVDEQLLRFEQVRHHIREKVLSRLDGSATGDWPLTTSRRRNKRLLIIGCSERKRALSGPVPAIELYDGPIFRTLRGLGDRLHAMNGTEVLIVSARYGVITPWAHIETYDELMDPELARAQASGNTSRLSLVASGVRYDDVLVCLGKRYLPAVGDISRVFGGATSVRFAEGRIGERTGAVRRWLSR